MINKFFTFFISIFLIIVVVSPIIINTLDMQFTKVYLENNEEEKENKTELTQEFEVDHFVLGAQLSFFLKMEDSKPLFNLNVEYRLLTIELSSPPPESQTYNS